MTFKALVDFFFTKVSKLLHKCRDFAAYFIQQARLTLVHASFETSTGARLF